jgi:hypothetical protein
MFMFLIVMFMHSNRYVYMFLLLRHVSKLLCYVLSLLYLCIFIAMYVQF